MSYGEIIIIKDSNVRPDSFQNAQVISFYQLKEWVVSGAILKRMLHYRVARLFVSQLEVNPHPLLTALILRFLSRGNCYLHDDHGQSRQLTFFSMIRLLACALEDYLRLFGLLRNIRNEVKRLSCEEQQQIPINCNAAPAYLRTDFCFGFRCGGSIGHTAGVINNLEYFTGKKPLFFTADSIPTVRGDLETTYIPVPKKFWDFKDVPILVFNEICEQTIRCRLNGKKPAFIYQRYGLNNYTGAKLAREYRVPLVLEYNGSELWIGRNWGRPAKYESLSLAIELLDLRAANVVVVVSRPMRDEIVDRGIDPKKILVNPNGVEPEKYSPKISGDKVREKYLLVGKTVIGFIGTFGQWHGAEVLAESFSRLLKTNPHYKENVRLMMIGDGVTMAQVKKILHLSKTADCAILTGSVPQDRGPEYLAACDILASPHIPNADGTPFFGSPTKLFEYMAMSKGIVASDLEQIGEVLRHRHSAWMVEPGNCAALTAGLKVLVEDKKLREEMGKNARGEVMKKYTWKQHTRKIVEKLKDCCQVI